MAPRTDPAQEAVLASDEAHLLVVAPPGTGKTSLAARLAVRDAATFGRIAEVARGASSN